MLPNVRRTAIATLAVLSLAATTAVPAQAWGEKEQNLVKGLAAAAIIGAVIMNNRKSQPAATQSYRQPQYQPQYQAPRQTYQTPARYQEPSYQPSYRSGIYASPAAQAFNGLSAEERRAVQVRLSNWGYYHGGIDGAFGPQTHRAIMAYAGDTQGTNQLSTVAGAYDFYGQLIR